MQVERYYNSLNHTISYGYNTLIKTYANGEKKIKYTTYSILKGLVRNKSSTSNSSSEYQEYKNLYKSKQNLIDLAYHNSMIVPWKYFVTLEFNANEIDYKDYSQVSSLLQKFTNNLKHQNPNLRYLIVPELHPNTGGIHFHGLLADCPNLKLVEAKSPRTGKPIYKNGCKIYNIKNYKYGFTTASEVKGQEQVSVYLSKYMTKTLIQIGYKKRYWATRNLERPKIEYASFDEDTLKFYISDKFVKSKYVKDKENSKSVFLNIV